MVGGTAWLLSRPEHDQAFDFLVVDEAGEFSLANLTAAGACARNIVLVGEAPICIVSMATSSTEELPRNIEFLFSVNRLNVAISRAQALSIVIASPRLLDVPCSTIEQMRLVNALCAVETYSARDQS